MSDPTEPDDLHLGRHDVHEMAQRDLALLAFGEQVDAPIDQHVRTCPVCSHDLDDYRRVVVAAQSIEHAPDLSLAPPPQVWQRIAAEVGMADAPPVPTRSGVANTAAAPPLRPAQWRRVLLAAAAVVALAGAGVTGWAIGHRSSTVAADRSVQAALAAQPGTSGSAHGTAVVHSSGAGATLSVVANGLPAPQGYYEVWLFNPSINQMVAVGTLGAGARGSFTVPAGIDLRAYHVVDVSAQRYDGDNTHDRSVLQGPLTP